TPWRHALLLPAAPSDAAIPLSPRCGPAAFQRALHLPAPPRRTPRTADLRDPAHHRPRPRPSAWLSGGPRLWRPCHAAGPLALHRGRTTAAASPWKTSGALRAVVPPRQEL